MTAEYLGVPDEFLEPIGRMAVAAGRIENDVALIYRVFLSGVHAEAKHELLAGRGFDRLAQGVRRFSKMDVVSGIDETFAADWATWEKRARDFMNFRNAWVHAVSAQTANGEWMPVTAVRPVTDPKLVTAVDIIIRAASGRWVAIDGRDYITRALRVVRAEAYTTPSPSGFPPGVDPF